MKSTYPYEHDSSHLETFLPDGFDVSSTRVQDFSRTIYRDTRQSLLECDDPHRPSDVPVFDCCFSWYLSLRLVQVTRVRISERETTTYENTMQHRGETLFGNIMIRLTQLHRHLQIVDTF